MKVWPFRARYLKSRGAFQLGAIYFFMISSGRLGHHVIRPLPVQNLLENPPSWPQSYYIRTAGQIFLNCTMYLGDAISNISGSFSCQDVDHAGVYLVSNVLVFHGFKYLYWIDVQQCRNLIVVKSFWRQGLAYWQYCYYFLSSWENN